jgi:hypothetical protein
VYSIAAIETRGADRARLGLLGLFKDHVLAEALVIALQLNTARRIALILDLSDLGWAFCALQLDDFTSGAGHVSSTK